MARRCGATSGADRVLSTYFGRPVTLTHVSPEAFVIDQVYADVEGAAPEGKEGTVVEQKLGAALFEELGMPSPVPPGLFPTRSLSVLTYVDARAANRRDRRPTSTRAGSA